MVFFALPLVTLKMTDTEQITTYLLSLLFRVNPSASFIMGVVFGVRNGFRKEYPLTVALWALIAVGLLYGDTQFLVCPVVYFLCGAGGCYVGSMFKQHRDEMYL